MYKRCPDCSALLKQKDISKNKCWKCGSTSIQEEFKSEKNTKNELINNNLVDQDPSKESIDFDKVNIETLQTHLNNLLEKRKLVHSEGELFDKAKLAWICWGLWFLSILFRHSSQPDEAGLEGQLLGVVFFVLIVAYWKLAKRITKPIDKEIALIRNKIREKVEIQESQERQREIEKRQREIEKRKKDLIKKYGDALGEKVFNGELFLDMTKEMLIDAFGKPGKTKEQVSRKKTTTKYYYKGRVSQQSTVVFGLEVTLENDVVSGWKELE